jgi:hypothetical protein
VSANGVPKGAGDGVPKGAGGGVGGGGGREYNPETSCTSAWPHGSAPGEPQHIAEPFLITAHGVPLPEMASTFATPLTDTGVELSL